MRTAFHLWPAVDHRFNASNISSVAVTEDARTLYLGLSDGQIEQYSISGSQQGVRTSLRARKHIGKKVRSFLGKTHLVELGLAVTDAHQHVMQPIQDICHLHSAHRLAIVCDGQLMLLDQESLEGHNIPNIKVPIHTTAFQKQQHCFLCFKCAAE